MSTRKYTIQIGYDGTSFSGWQIQKGRSTVQWELNRALSILVDEEIHVVGSGRTDAGVHAVGQVGHFLSSRLVLDNRSLTEWLQKLNAILPSAICVSGIKQVDASFHARYSAIRKTYTYTMDYASVQSPFTHLYATWISSSCDRDLLCKALTLFVGKKDFTSFANENYRGSAFHQPIKTVFSITPFTPKEGVLVIVFKGNGFLYKMVRNLMGTALAVAQKKLPIEEIPKLFAAKDRTLVPPPAAAKGLCLESVEYPFSLFS